MNAASDTEQRIRVAIADDNRDLCVVLAELVNITAGLVCVGVVTQREAVLDAVSTLQPDVLILDLMLGGSSSLTLLPELASTSPTTRVLVHSGYHLDELAADSVRRGAVAYVAKGGEPDELLDMIRRVGGDPR